MRDSEVVAAIVARDPDGLAAAYDKYAAGLFSFCRSLLREPADAADAVQDTFVIAASKVAELRDPSRLRPWLYAVARNECHRRLRAGNVPATLAETAYVADLADQAADAGDRAARAQLRDLVRAAIMGLNPGDQEVIELSLRHELDGPDLADALGVPRNHAHALASRARSQLEKSLGALLVARAGRQACPALDNLLSGWDGRMTVLMRKRVNRHIERCEVCGERKRRELRPVMLLGVAPLSMIPGELRAQVLHLLTDTSPAAVVQRAAIVHRAGVLGPQGFPAVLPAHGVAGTAKAAATRAGLRWQLAHGHTTAIAGAAATAAVAGVTAVLVLVLPQHAHRGGSAAVSPGEGARPTATATAGTPASGAPGPPGTSPPAHARATAQKTHGTAGSLAQLGVSMPAGPGTAAANGGHTPNGAGPPAGTGATTPPAGTGGGGGTGTPFPTPTAPAPPPPVVNGPVSVAPARLVLISLLSGSASGTLTLSAGSTPVTHYTISIPSSLLGHLTASPASGSIPAHQSQPVTVTLHGLLSVGTTITVSPGGQTVTVVLGLHLGT